MKLTRISPKKKDAIIRSNTRYCSGASQHGQFVRGIEIGIQAQLEACEKEAGEKMELLVKGIFEEIEKHRLKWQGLGLYRSGERVGDAYVLGLTEKEWQALKDKILKEIGGEK